MAEHYVRAYSLYQHGQYLQASIELGHVDIAAIGSDAEAYRLSPFCAAIRCARWGRRRTPLPFLEEALDLARDMHDDQRASCTRSRGWCISIPIPEISIAPPSIWMTRSRLAVTLNDAGGTHRGGGAASDIADQRGDRAAERRASLAALEQAKLSGSIQGLAHALANLGDSYLKTHDFNESLKYSKQALPLVIALAWAAARRPSSRSTKVLPTSVSATSSPARSWRRAPSRRPVAGDNLLDAQELLREYGDALEHAGYLMMAIQAYHRHDELGQNDHDQHAPAGVPRALGKIRRRAQGARARIVAAGQ